eukprot:scaffold6519_cov23-Prasinocladus_malaysianus.AAC.1
MKFISMYDASSKGECARHSKRAEVRSGTTAVCGAGVSAYRCSDTLPCTALALSIELKGNVARNLKY